MITIQQILSLGDVKEAQVKAFFSFYWDKLGEDYENIIQEKTTDYANSLAKSFILNYKEFFDNRQNRIEFYNKMHDIGAHRHHSGNKFCEALYKEVISMENIHEK